VTLHFIYGLPGAGKTRLARELAGSLPAVAFIEDAYLAATSAPIATLEQYVERSQRLRELLIGPTALQVLRLGVSVVFDFAANTVAGRAWVRSIFEAAGADHVLHVLDVPVDECRRRVHERNASKPEGLYHGDVSDAIFDQVVPHIVAPTASEGFRIVSHAWYRGTDGGQSA
jgi:predicted kinase